MLSQERRDAASFLWKRKGKTHRVGRQRNICSSLFPILKVLCFDFVASLWYFSAICLSKVVAFSFISGDTSRYVCITSISKESWCNASAREENGVVYCDFLSYSFLFSIILQVCTSSLEISLFATFFQFWRHRTEQSSAFLFYQFCISPALLSTSYFISVCNI